MRFVSTATFLGFLYCSLAIAASASTDGIPRYVDVTAQAGIRFQHVSGKADQKDYIFETKGGGIGFFDYDGDGWLDILIVQGSTVADYLAGKTVRPGLFRNRRDGTFEDVSAGSGLSNRWGMGVTFGDYDNDGDPDVYLTELGPDRLYRNNGDGTFTDVTAKAGIQADGWSTSAAFADSDGDGDLDLYVAAYLDYDPTRLPPKTADCTYLGVPVLCGPRGLRGAEDHLFRNRGDGTFEEVTDAAGVRDRGRYFGLGVVWADLDNDGDPDLVVGNDATPNYLYVNDGSGHFEEMGFISGVAVSGDGNEQASMGIDAADYDNDGLLDLFMTHFASDYSTLYHNEGELLFTDVSALAGLKDPEWLLVAWGTRFVDVNLDGWKDIVHSNGHVYPYLAHSDKAEVLEMPCSAYLNKKDGTFQDVSSQVGPDFQTRMVGRGAAFGDYDNDGDIDLLLAQLNGSPRLLRADRTDSNHWIMLRLNGTSSNRDAIGARIDLKCDGLSQVWEIKRTVGIYSASDPRAHFGLGACSSVEAIHIRWPDGKVRTLRDVPADHHYRLTEGSELQEEPLR